MKITVYENGLPVGDKELPADMIQKCYEVAQYMIDTGTLSIYGIGPVFDLQAKLDKAIAERDSNGKMCDQAQELLEEILDQAEAQQKELEQVKREKDIYLQLATNAKMYGRA